MSKEQARAFLQRSADPAVVEAAKAADDPLAALVDAGAEAGFDFTREELAQCASAASGELSEDQLESVAGGIGAIGPLGDLMGDLDVAVNVPQQDLTKVPGSSPVARDLDTPD